MAYHAAASDDVVVDSGRMADVEAAKGAYDFRGMYDYDGSDYHDGDVDDDGKAVSASAASSHGVVVYDGDVQRKARILLRRLVPRVHVR